MLWPYRGPDYRRSGDLDCVLGMTVEASNALAEGQFPIRVAPRQRESMRFPLFQYYGNFPYTVTGLISRGVDGNPYTAWKIAMLLTFVVGAVGAEKLAYLLTRRRGASVLAAVVFLIAPYQFTDMNARGAFSEQLAFNLLPIAFYFSFRAFLSRRWRYVPACAVAWAVVGLTHNIAYVYGVLFMAALFLSYTRLTRRSLERIPRLAAAGALQAGLVLWYFVPQLLTMKLLIIGNPPLDPYVWADLNPLYVLLSPRLTATPAAVNAPGLGLQVGWPILAGAVLTCLALALRRQNRFRRATALRLVLLLAASFFITWSPFDFWKHVPLILWFVQFPYRMLMFVVLFGALVAGLALSGWFPRRIPWPVACVAAFLLALSTLPFLRLPAEIWPHFVEGEMSAPNVGAGALAAYFVLPSAVQQTSWLPVDFNRADWDYVLQTIDAQKSAPAVAGKRVPVAADRNRVKMGRIVHYSMNASSPVLLELPVLYYPRVMEVRDNGVRIKHGNVGHYLAVKLPPGRHHLAIRYVGIHWANTVSAVGWLATCALAVVAVVRRLVLGNRERDQLAGC